MLAEFALPPHLEAHEPPEARGLPRDGVRLLVTFLGSDRIEHSAFRDLPRYLRAGDVLVINTSRTLPAALRATRSDGGEILVHLSTPLDAGEWIVEPRQAAVEAGEVLALPGGGSATMLHPQSPRLWVARLDLPLPDLEYLARHGRPIRYSYVTGEWPIEAYQNVYAREPGSVEMPSAGRPFTEEMVTELVAAGVVVVPLVLHAGVASLERGETPPAERYRVPAPTAAVVNAVRAAGGRVVAVGTTVVRALETVADDRGRLRAGEGWTDLVITPEMRVRAVDALLTGLHEPRATHLAMLEALAGPYHVRRAYEAAVAGGYLWHEFGDLHLILP